MKSKRYEIENTPLKHTDGLVVPFTKSLTRDEPALMLVEENRFTADTLSEHRFQSIFVGRGNSVFEFPRDLGPSTLYAGVEGFILFSGGYDSCGQLMDMAENERGNNKTAQVLAEAGENSTLIKDAVAKAERTRELVKRNKRTLEAQYDIRHERTIF